MSKYEVTGRPIGDARFATAAIGSSIDLDLAAGEEKDLIASGAIRRPSAKKQPEPESEQTVTLDKAPEKKA